MDDRDTELAEIVAVLAVAAQKLAGLGLAAPTCTRVDLGHACHDLDRAIGFIRRVQNSPQRWDGDA